MVFFVIFFYPILTWPVCQKVFSIDKLMEKLDNTKPVEKTPEEEKEWIDKIFEKKQIGRPSGTFDTKRVQYLKMLNDQKIKQPKTATLEYYNIEKDGDKYVLVM